MAQSGRTRHLCSMSAPVGKAELGVLTLSLKVVTQTGSFGGATCNPRSGLTRALYACDCGGRGRAPRMMQKVPEPHLAALC